MNGILRAGRSLSRSPWYTLCIVGMLGCGIGATTAVFTVVNSVLFRALPFPDSESLVEVTGSAVGLGYERIALAPDLYFRYRNESDVFEDLGLYRTRQATLRLQDNPVRLVATNASASFFSTLGVTPILGRTFTTAEDVPGGPDVVVLGHALWTGMFGRRPDIIGQQVTIDNVSYEVVGVMPDLYQYPGDTDVWTPLRMTEQSAPVGRFGWWSVARLRDGYTLSEAESELAPLVQRVLDEAGIGANYRSFLERGRYRTVLWDVRESVVGAIRRPLWVLFAAVWVVLLVACINAIHLAIVRSDARGNEAVVKLAMGARWTNLAGEHAAEAGLISLTAGAVGMAIALLGVPTLLRWAPDSMQQLSHVSVDWAAYAFACATASICAVALALLPTLRHTRSLRLASLARGGRFWDGGRASRIRRQAAVVGQIASALVVLAVTGLLGRSLRNALEAEVGFEARGAIVFDLSLPSSRYPDVGTLHDFATELHRSLASLPGGPSVGATSSLPLAMPAPARPYVRETSSGISDSEERLLHYKHVSRHYFVAAGIPLLAGAPFAESAFDTTATSIIVNEVVAEQLWPEESAVGQRLRPAQGDAAEWLTVVGVVAPVLQDGLKAPPPPLIYYPLYGGRERTAIRDISWVVRVPSEPGPVALIRPTVWEVDSDVPVPMVREFQQIVAAEARSLSFTAVAVGVSSMVALILAAGGMYGVLSWIALRRRREFGIRVALGAERSSVLATVLMEAAWLGVVGIVLGVLILLALTATLRGILFDVSPLDPLTLLVAAGVVFVITCGASYVPALRAATAPPMEAIGAAD